MFVCERVYYSLDYRTWEGCPVWDAARMEVVQAEGKNVKKQPGHWLRMIEDFGWGWGDGVGW